eukprot:gene23329-biopygen4317
MSVTRPRYSLASGHGVWAGPHSWGPNPRHIPLFGPGGCLRARATGNGPALQVRGRTAGAPTPDIWRGGEGPFTGPPYRIAAPAPWVTGPPYRFRGRTAGAPTPDICFGPGGSSPPGVWGRCAVPHTPTGPPYRLRARATGRGRIAGAPTPDIWGQAGSSPPGVGCIVASRPGSGRLSRFGVGAVGRGRIIRLWGGSRAIGSRLRARPTGNAPALQGGAVQLGPQPQTYGGRRASPSGAGPYNSPYRGSRAKPVPRSVYCSLRVCSHCRACRDSGQTTVTWVSCLPCQLLSVVHLVHGRILVRVSGSDAPALQVSRTGHGSGPYRWGPNPTHMGPLCFPHTPTGPPYRLAARGHGSGPDSWGPNPRHIWPFRSSSDPYEPALPDSGARAVGHPQDPLKGGGPGGAFLGPTPTRPRYRTPPRPPQGGPRPPDPLRGTRKSPLFVAPPDPHEGGCLAARGHGYEPALQS